MAKRRVSKILRNGLGLAVVGLLLSHPPLAQAGEDGYAWRLARQAVRTGKDEVAFSYYRAIIRSYPRSKYYQKSLFAVGEYYKDLLDVREASRQLKKFVQKYPNDKVTIFALALLLDMARIKKDLAKVQEYQRLITEFKQISFVFKEFEKYTFVSPFKQEYSVIHRIDKIEFFLNDQPFADISF